jgi:hypothetical protein
MPGIIGGVSHYWMRAVSQRCYVMPAKAGIQYSVMLAMNTNATGYWIIRWSLSSGRPEAGPGGG